MKDAANPLFGSRRAATPAPKLTKQEKADALRAERFKAFKAKGGEIVERNGYVSWLVNGLAHNEDGPAKEMPDGTLCWCYQGEFHRSDGPAIERADGTKEWYVYGERHRSDGPAVEKANGDQGWYHQGKRHRANGPAVTDAHGRQEYWAYGQLHREDGPAIVRPNGGKEWYWKGQHCDAYEHDKLKFNHYLEIWQESQRITPEWSQNVDEITLD